MKFGEKAKGFGTLSVFGMEKHTKVSKDKLLGFGTLSVFGMEKQEYVKQSVGH